MFWCPPARCREGSIVLGRRGVAAFDNLPNARAACYRRQRLVLLDGGRFSCQLVILDCVAKPLRVSARTQVMQPRLVIDAGGQLEKGREVLCTQVECSLGATEIEALVL